jgi:hypothetical protein
VDEFDVYMSACQVEWRQSQSLPEGQGWQNRKQRPWILPQKHWEEGLWPGIRSGSAYSLSDYLQRNRIQKHQGVYNLKSSWMLCANLYFPFGASEEGRALLAGFLQACVSPEIRSVDAVELEYAEPEGGPLHPSSLLGEQDGSRGAGQTSPDVAFLVNGGQGLVLTENKFVEHSFYRCSARTREGSGARPGNPDLSRCNDTLALIDGFETLCYQVAWGRRYWEYLAPVTNKEMASSLRCCPAARAGYQLFRQQALAEGIAASGKYAFVVSSVVLDERNETLIHCLRSTGISDVRHWGELFRGRAGFRVVTHQQWVAWVRAHDDDGHWADWLSYVESRYGYTP